MVAYDLMLLGSRRMYERLDLRFILPANIRIVRLAFLWFLFVGSWYYR